MINNNKTSLGTRVQKLLNHKNLNYRSLSKVIPYSDVQVRRICLDESVPKIDFIQHLIRFFEDVNPIWIVTGEGNFLKETSLTSLESYPKKEILDFLLENRAAFLNEEPKKVNLLIEVLSTISQRKILEDVHKKVEEFNLLLKKNTP